MEATADDLLSRLQAATGPSRELDAEIALAHGWKRIPRIGFQPEDWWRSPIGQLSPQLPRYTESIDAALTLLPKGWVVHTIHAGTQRDGMQSWSVDICRNHNWTVQSEGVHVAATPAIALLIAIMRAHPSTSAQEDSKRET